MKNLFFLILFVFINVISLNAQWVPCNNGLKDNVILCFITDGNNTYTGMNGGVFLTTDNGEQWIEKNKGIKSFMGLAINSLAISGDNIYAGTFFYGIYLSTDKGENWVCKSNGLPFKIINSEDTLYNIVINAILINANNMFACTDSKGIFLSTDYGDKWQPINNGLPLLDTLPWEISSIAIKGDKMFIGTVDNGVYFTTDNGDNWVLKNKGLSSLDSGVYSLAIKGNYIFAGTRRGIYLSTDNGDNWHFSGLKDFLSNGFCILGNNIFTASYGVYLSTDNGNSWISKNEGLTYFGTTSLIINGDYIFVGTSPEGIFRAKLSDLGITDVKETNQNDENMIYPNPTSSEFKLKFESTSVSKTQISIVDMLGNEVFSSSGDSSPGSNEKTIDCRSLATGYYIVKIRQNEKVESKPLMIIK